MTLPTVTALSVRQPWAWAIIHAGKDVENRSQAFGRRFGNFRGPLLIHAAKGMTRDEYESAAGFMDQCCDVQCPAPGDLQRGGIIGHVCVVDWVVDSTSPWFMGPRALVLTEPVSVPFIGCPGQLGMFKPDLAANTPPVAAAKWMIAVPDRKQVLDRICGLPSSNADDWKLI